LSGERKRKEEGETKTLKKAGMRVTAYDTGEWKKKKQGHYVQSF